MKKFLLTATMLVCLSALSKAQQGRVGINTTTPAATLDIAADPATTTKPDALLVPRMTRAQLLAKDNAYTAAQNGALAFITTIDGTATTKTANVTTVGFYYYDGQTTNTWITVGSGGAVAPTIPTFRTIPGTAVTTINTTDVGNIVVITGNVNGDIQLPAPSISMVGKKLTLISTGSGVQTLTTLNSNYLTNTLASIQQYATELITDGTNWYSLGGQ
ncbi:hypothetical protein EG347_09085 [Chryseobacterium sp. G0186]|uniref:hypothetical protein n=1 Tax=Chryseobacterium sp. G0186 TaxID=2487064 RepID=UPI000F4E68BA|nr:hypothetical protein [Chryseobacterium sp. G0186]AZA77660.1 hypothetical protein EG347_09085 [Chryseobacterium sp. G0186]